MSLLAIQILFRAYAKIFYIAAKFILAAESLLFLLLKGSRGFAWYASFTWMLPGRKGDDRAK